MKYRGFILFATLLLAVEASAQRDAVNNVMTDGHALAMKDSLRKESVKLTSAKPTKIFYIQDTIIKRDTLIVVDTIRVDMTKREFNKKYNVED